MMLPAMYAHDCPIEPHRKSLPVIEATATAESLGFRTAVPPPRSDARFLPPEPNVRTLKRGGTAKRRDSVRMFG
jgi:hypothetical protein